MATLATGGYTGQVYIAPVGTEPPTGKIDTSLPKWANLGSFTTSFSGTFSTGGKKLASVNVADLFEVYPELASEYYVGGWGPEDSNFKEEQDFADNIVKAAQHVRNKKALKSLPKIKNNKEDK